jgi:hypothetical protein
MKLTKYGLNDRSTISNSKIFSKPIENVKFLVGHELTILNNGKHFIEQSISFILNKNERKTIKNWKQF